MPLAYGATESKATNQRIDRGEIVRALQSYNDGAKQPERAKWDCVRENRAAVDQIRHDRDRLERAVKEAGSDLFRGKSCRCPFHDDRTPSAALLKGDDGAYRFHCRPCGWTGDLYDVLARARGKALVDVIVEEARLTPKLNVKQSMVASYDYRNEYGDLLFQVCRFEPGRDGGRKDFRQRRPDGKGGWTWDIQGVRRVLYCLPQLMNGAEDRPDDFVFIAEGEKDVDSLWARGLIGTTNSGGAGRWRDDYNAALFLRKIRIIPDADPTGQAHANAVARSLIDYHQRAGQIADVAIMKLPSEVSNAA